MKPRACEGGAWWFAHKGSILVKDRRFPMKLFAIPAVVLIAAFAYVILNIQSEGARQPQQYLGQAGDSHIKSAQNTTSGIADESSSGVQFRREEFLALEAKKERQEVNDCESPAAAVELPLRCTTLESDLALVMQKREEEVAKKKAERLTLESEKKRQEEAAANKDAERQVLEAKKKRQEDAANLEAERLGVEAENRQQEEANKDEERQALEANKKRQEEAVELEVERLALEAEKTRLEETAAKNEADRLALEAEKKRQEEAAAKNEAERLALAVEKERQEEAARKDAERLALAADQKRQDELTGHRPDAAGETPATEKTNQQIVVPNIVGPASAPEATLETGVTGTLKPSVTAVQAATGPVSADLPAFAPSRVVLTYPRNDKAAAERTTALRQALTAANVEVVKVEAVEVSRPTPGLGYYFRSDHDAAVDVSHRVQPLLGTVEPALLEIRGKVPPPGTIEVAVPGRGAR
jgi:hypothetical protein